MSIDILDELPLEVNESKQKIIDDHIKASEKLKDDMMDKISHQLSKHESVLLLELNEKTPTIIGIGNTLRDLYSKSYEAFYSGKSIIGDYEKPVGKIQHEVMLSEVDYIINIVMKCQVMLFAVRDHFTQYLSLNVNGTRDALMEILKILKKNYDDHEKEVAILRSKHQLILNSLI